MDDLDDELLGQNETGEEGDEEREELRKLGEDWLARIQKSEDDEQSWITHATEAETAYSCDDEDTEAGYVPDFNILHSNVETIIPSLYNSTPTPDIRPRHGADQDNAKDAADVYERAVTTSIDDGALDTEMEDVVRDAELAGRGIIWVKFDADLIDEAAGRVEGPELIYESVAWRDFRIGPAKKWRDVPWVARLHTFTDLQLLRFSDETLRELQIDPEQEDADLEGDDHDVWEIWDKDLREVLFIEADTGFVLKRSPDPYGLKRFFPCPRPVQPITLTGKLTPICPYRAYQTLASELDTVTRRINALLDLLKAKALIAGGIASDIDKLKDADDGEMVISEDLASLVAAGGLDKGIIWWPIETIIAVIRELEQQRAGLKQTIYEVTGISDIVRGASVASETATAQQIKTQWGSLRIKRLQAMVQRCVREIFLISAELMANRFPLQHIAHMAGVELTEELAAILERPFDHLRIDVESDSTVRADLTQRREEMSQFLAATGTFMQVAAPIIQENPGSMNPLMEIFAAFARQFSLGKQAEDAIDSLILMAKKMVDSGEAEKKEARVQEMQDREMKRQDAEAQAKLAESQAKVAESQARQKETDGRLKLEARKVSIEEGKLRLEERRLGTEEISKLAELSTPEDQAEVTVPAAVKGGKSTGNGETNETQEGSDMARPEDSEFINYLEALFKVLLEAIQQQSASIEDGQARIAQTVMEGQEALAKALTAPKEVVRDQAGRSTGVRTLLEDTKGAAGAAAAPQRFSRDPTGRVSGTEME